MRQAFKQGNPELRLKFLNPPRRRRRRQKDTLRRLGDRPQLGSRFKQAQGSQIKMDAVKTDIAVREHGSSTKFRAVGWKNVF